MIKRFLEWIQLKEKLHKNNSGLPSVSEGEIWWASIGDNIGKEMNGKGKKFTRPVYIYHKLSHDSYIIIPTTTGPKEGSWYVNISHEGNISALCMHQMRNIDYRRLHTKIMEVNDLDKLRIYYSFLTLYGSKIKSSTKSRTQ